MQQIIDAVTQERDRLQSVLNILTGEQETMGTRHVTMSRYKTGVKGGRVWTEQQRRAQGRAIKTYWAKRHEKEAMAARKRNKKKRERIAFIPPVALDPGVGDEAHGEVL